SGFIGEESIGGQFGRSASTESAGQIRVSRASSSSTCGVNCSDTPRHSPTKSYGYRGTIGAQERHKMTNLPASHAKRVADFLQKVRATCGRLAFIIDATGSREHTWDAASQLQSEMFVEAGKFGTLEMQVTYFGGLNNVANSDWTGDAHELQHFMGRVRCDTGHTKYARALAHVRDEHRRQSINAVILIGDMLEEEPRMLYDAVGGLGVPCFCFQEGDDFRHAETLALREAFTEMARLTKGAYCAFDSSSIGQLRELLRAVAAFATGGLTALADQRTDSARKLLGQLK